MLLGSAISNPDNAISTLIVAATSCSQYLAILSKSPSCQNTSDTLLPSISLLGDGIFNTAVKVSKEVKDSCHAPNDQSSAVSTILNSHGFFPIVLN